MLDIIIASCEYSPMRYAGTSSLSSLGSLLCMTGLLACTGGGEPVQPASGRVPNLRLQQVVFTQVTQDSAGSVALVTGRPAAVKVLVTRSIESVAEVSVVLRLFRNGAQVYADTAATGGVLGRGASLNAASAELLVPGEFVTPAVSWQVEIDPQLRTADSTRSDNRLPLGQPMALRTVDVPPLLLHFVPVILTQHDRAQSDVSVANVEQYAQLARRMLPAASVQVSLGAPVVSTATFGTGASGGSLAFWQAVGNQVDQARTSSGVTTAYWVGVVPLPAGFTSVSYSGYGYLPSTPGEIGGGSRTSVVLAINPLLNAQQVQMLVAHELGHNFGRGHTPGCNAGAPLDTLYPTSNGAILGVGSDVWSWAAGLTRGSASYGPQTVDVMSYCDPGWIGWYSYEAMMRWRDASTVVTRTTQTGAPIGMP